MKNFTKVFLGLLVGLILGLGVMQAYATPDINVQTRSAAGNPYVLKSVTTSATVTLQLNPDYVYTIAHMGIQDDGSTASVSTDYVVVMHQSVTMDATYTDGNKCILKPNGYLVIRGIDAKDGTDGRFELAMKANGHGAKIQITAQPRPNY